MIEAAVKNHKSSAVFRKTKPNLREIVLDVTSPLLAFLVFFSSICAAIQLSLGVYATERGLTGDEAAHMVNALLVFDWLHEAPLSNPLRFAEAYYLHFPRVSIGHWPPLFYTIQAAVFAFAGRSSAAALGLQALIGGLACAWPASLAQRRCGWLAGTTAGLFVLASPNLLFLLDAVMVDTLLGLWIMAAGLCWARFAVTGRVAWSVLFAATAAGAILTKGNGFALTLLPLLHAALTRDLRLLLNWRAWLAAMLVFVLVGPWYGLTWRMAADGFNYRWGWDYTGPALSAYALDMVETIGAVGVLGFAATLWNLTREGRAAQQDQTIAVLAAAVLAVLLFQLIVPADITSRYLVALVPSAAVPVTAGLGKLVRLARLRQAAAGGVIAALLLCGSALIFVPPHLSPFGMMALAREVMDRPSPNPLVLVIGSPRAEGALIAAFAELDPGRTHYVLRGTQILAQGGFMGQDYRTRFPDAGAAGRWLAGSGIGWLVIDLSADADTFVHNRQMAEVTASAATGWTQVAERRRLDGEVRLYKLQDTAPTAAEVKALLARVAPNTYYSPADIPDSPSVLPRP